MVCRRILFKILQKTQLVECISEYFLSLFGVGEEDKIFMDREVTACQGNPGDPV